MNFTYGLQSQSTWRLLEAGQSYLGNVTTVVPIRDRFFSGSTNGCLRTHSLIVYSYAYSRRRSYPSVSSRWPEKAMRCSYAAAGSKYHMDSFQPHVRSLRDISAEPYPILLLPLAAITDIALSLSSGPGTRDRPVTQNETCRQCSLDTRKTGSAHYCGSGMPFFAVDSDECRSSDVTRASASPIY